MIPVMRFGLPAECLHRARDDFQLLLVLLEKATSMTKKLIITHEVGEDTYQPPSGVHRHVFLGHRPASCTTVICRSGRYRLAFFIAMFFRQIRRNTSRTSVGLGP
jgi:hypothetical protein